MSDRAPGLPPAILQSQQSREDADRRRREAERRREQAEAPGRRLREAGQAFHGWAGALGNELRRRPTDSELFDHFLRLRAGLHEAVEVGGFRDFWDVVRAVLPTTYPHPAAAPDVPSAQEIDFWLTTDEAAARLAFGTPKGRRSWEFSLRFIGYDLSEFTSDYLYLRGVGTRPTLGDFQSKLGPWSLTGRRVLAHFCPDAERVRDAFRRAFESADFDGRTLGRWIDHEARAEGVAQEVIEGRSLDWAVERLEHVARGEADGEGENPPGWVELGDAKRAILTVLRRTTGCLQGRGIAVKAGYKHGTLRHHFGELQTSNYIDKTKDGYAITPTGAALVPCERV